MAVMNPDAEGYHDKTQSTIKFSDGWSYMQPVATAEDA
jgi:hypothetical protein